MHSLADVFGGDGLLAAHIPGFAERPQQTTMAAAVGEALGRPERLVIEAGTGIGKTFAYLVPALLSGCRVIISTGTRNLQDQLYGRDLPTVSAALGRPVKVALLKGRANYLCRHRLELSEQVSRTEPAAVGKLGRLRVWSRLTRSGDIAEVPGIPEDDVIWSRVTSTSENCLGMRCPEYSRCHVVQARRVAQDSDIVIVNHHLLLADLVLKEEGFGELLPAFDAVILDEAHQLPEIAAQFFGVVLGSRQVLGLARDTRAEDLGGGPPTPDLQAILDELEKAVYDTRLVFGPQTGRRGWGEAPGAATTRLDALLECLRRLRDALEGVAGEDSEGLGHCRRRAEQLARDLNTVLRAEPAAGVRWVDLSPRGFRLHLTPVDAAETLGSHIDAHEGAWVFTSATLAVGSEFEHFTARVGLGEARTVQLDSPFDYARNALLYLPEDLPEPSAAGHTAAVLEQATPLIEASGGRTFLLFTSHRALSEAASLLAEQHTLPFPCLVQGSAPRDLLLRRFRESGNGVLLGTGSFWEGVDVRGAALQLVVIDKLPFAAPNDPLLQARLEAIRQRGGNPFREYQLPQAVIALKQGVGRLIRAVDDRGVAMICDPRLRTRSYGRVFLSSLPPMRQTSRADEALQFMEGLAGGPPRARAL